MTEIFDTSRISDRPEHWDALATRVARQAIVHAERRAGIARFVAARGTWIAASVLVAIAATVVIVADSPSYMGPTTEWSASLHPSDQIGRAIAGREQPPAIAELLFSVQSLEGGR